MGQPQHERAPLAFAALGGEIAIHRARELAADGEAKPDAFLLALVAAVDVYEGSKMLASFSGAMPRPVSRTTISTKPSASWQVSEIRPRPR